MDFSSSNIILQKLLTHFSDLITSDSYSKYFDFWPILLIGIVISLILTPLIGHFAQKYDITYKPFSKRNEKDFDNPQKAMHEGITPSLGGLVLSLSIFCLLYTSDAADDLLCVDLGGRRIIKKKKST